MARIIGKNISLVYPMVGSNQRGRHKVAIEKGKVGSVGGKIITTGNSHRGVLALDGLNIDLKPGARFGILGSNGSGKSTLLRVLGGIYKPTGGDLNVTGRVTGMFNLNLGVSKEATGYQNIILKGLMLGLSRKKIDEHAAEIAEFSELGEYINMPVHTYSSGMVMRLMFSTATSFKPEILLLDEWIGTGDRNFRDKVDKRLNDLMEEALIVVIASHNRNRMSKWANTYIELKAGRGVQKDISVLRGEVEMERQEEIAKRKAAQ